MKSLKKLIAVISTIAAITIGFIALFIPPTGIISSSVLWFIAQLLLFTASMVGVEFDIKDIFKQKE